MVGERYTLSAFADEIAPDLETQISTLKALGIPGIDVRSVDNLNVLDLSLDALEKIRDRVTEAGLHVQCVGSPVNKVKYEILNQGRELDRLRRACWAADRLNTKRVRIFSPEVELEQTAELRGKVLSWMREQIRVAHDHGIILLHENDATYYGAYPDNAKILFEELGGPNFRAAFDFANTVLLGFRPRDWFPWLLPHLDTIHIKDAIESEKKVVPAGEGDGEMVTTLRELFHAGWSGALTLEPHLQAAGPLGGFSGPQRFEVATNALRSVLAKAESEQ